MLISNNNNISNNRINNKNTEVIQCNPNQQKTIMYNKLILVNFHIINQA